MSSASMPSRAARKRFSAMSSLAGNSSPGSSGRCELETRERLDERREGAHVFDRRLRVHDADLDGAEPRLQAGVPPQQRGIGDGARPQQPVDGRTQSE